MKNSPMDSILYKAAIAGEIDVLIRNQEKIGVQLTPDEKTVLHLASELGQTKAVKVIRSMYPLLISQANSSGKTALHLAVRGGHARVVQFLIDSARKLDDDEDIESGPHTWRLILWTANDDGKTALHEAARHNRREVLNMLVKEDPSYTHLVSKVGETPLYIAACRGFHELVDVILNNCEAPVYSGPNGTTALHGAVICGSEGALKVFDRPPKFAVKTDHINALTDHDSDSALVTQITYPQAAHNLLGYVNTRSSITDRGKGKDGEDSEVRLL